MMNSLELLWLSLLLYLAGALLSLLLARRETLAIYAAGLASLLGGVAGLFAAVGQVQGADFHFGTAFDQALQHLLGRDVAGLERGHFFADQGDVASGIAQQHAHLGFLLQGLAGQHQASALGHGFVGRDVDEQLGCLSGESEAAQYSSDQQRFFHGDSR
mgnify:CR=1 FL=1